MNWLNHAQQLAERMRSLKLIDLQLKFSDGNAIEHDHLQLQKTYLRNNLRKWLAVRGYHGVQPWVPLHTYQPAIGADALRDKCSGGDVAAPALAHVAGTPCLDTGPCRCGGACGGHHDAGDRANLIPTTHEPELGLHRSRL